MSIPLKSRSPLCSFVSLCKLLQISIDALQRQVFYPEGLATASSYCTPASEEIISLGKPEWCLVASINLTIAREGIGDLERSIARLCASSLGAFGRDNAAVVLYEDAAKRKVSAFLNVLKGLEKLQAS